MVTVARTKEPTARSLHRRGSRKNSTVTFRYPGQRQERLVDYYFWALEDLHERLPFICEKPQKDIGCYVGNGASYQGIANRGEAGDLCLNWTSPYLNLVLNEVQIANLGDLNHNHCRNPDNDDAPWCIGNFDIVFDILNTRGANIANF